MGRLIKNHWARLIVLSASAYQVAAAIEAFLWPKILWDFLTRGLDAMVKPAPVLQIINVCIGVFLFLLEWPMPLLADTKVQRSLEFRLAFLPLAALSAALLYQGTNAAVYQLIGLVVYFWAFSEGEMICANPWTLPQRNRAGPSKV